MVGMPGEDAAEWVSDLIAECHIRHEPFVGGLFNAYEKAVHYEILTRLYQRGRWDAKAEHPIPGTKGKCDLVIPLESGALLWLEVKLWWFFHGPLEAWTLDDAQNGPVDDWHKIAGCPGRRAVALVRMWDDEGAARATSLLAAVKVAMRTLAAPEPVPRELREFAYPAPHGYRARGDVHVWVSP